MIVPNKAISYEKSLFPKLPIILNILEKQSLTPIQLYQNVNKHFEDINQFLLTLDVLYILNKIDFTDGVLKYVD